MVSLCTRAYLLLILISVTFASQATNHYLEHIIAQWTNMKKSIKGIVNNVINHVTGSTNTQEASVSGKFARTKWNNATSYLDSVNKRTATMIGVALISSFALYMAHKKGLFKKCYAEIRNYCGCVQTSILAQSKQKTA